MMVELHTLFRKVYVFSVPRNDSQKLNEFSKNNVFA